MVRKHLGKEAILSTRDELVKRQAQAKKLLEDIGERDILSTNEFSYIKSTITKKAVPTVKLLIKDHKKKNVETGSYPSRLVVPAANFTAAFPHVGQRGLKAILDRNNVEYSRKTIKHALQLKEDLEKLEIKRSQSSIVTLDIEAMYPSIQIEHVKRAIEYFLRDASEEDKVKADSCLEMIRFGMANTMVTFGGKYYEYGGSNVESKGLTIGGYESAFLADLVAAFILENLEEMFHCDEGSTYSKIYRDDGIKVEMVANRTIDEICNWYEEFQSNVNALIGSDSLVFTMEIWKPDSPPEEVPRNPDKITICRDDAFPYLDLEMYWRNDELQFRVHLKPNQVLKYNENDDIYAACKCSSRFHKFTDIHSFALRTRLTQKKVTPKRKKRNSRSTGNKSSNKSESPICSPITPVLIDTNVPGLPYREPCTNPSRSSLHLAQRKVWDMRQALESETGIVDI